MEETKLNMANELIEYPNVEQALTELAEAVKAAYIANLNANGRPTERMSEWMRNHYDGKLTDTIKVVVTLGNGKFVASLQLNDYWKYVEEGVAPSGKYGNPGWKAYPAIRDWVDIKPVIPRPDGNGRIPTPNQLAYLITRSIVNNGTHGTHDLKMAKDAVIPMYIDRVEMALREDVRVIVLKTMNW